MNEEHLKPLSTAVLRLLRPLVRILLRNGLSYGTFSDLAKWVYVDVAEKEFGITGRKQSTSRISVMTGLTRKEVMRVRQIQNPDDSASAERYNRAARVIASWRRERGFQNAKGEPKPLPMADPGMTFRELVKCSSGDMPVRAVLDELLRVGAVERLKDGRVRLVSRAYIPEKSASHKLQILGTDVELLISTIGHNLKPGPARPRFQRKVLYDNLPDEILPDFQAVAEKNSQSLLEHLDRWLSSRDRDVTPSVEGTGRNRAGLGIYYFEGPFPSEEN